jgi:hypothetical protein
MSRSIRAGVGSFVGGLQSASHFWSPSRAPLDDHGAHQIPSLLRRSLEDIRDGVDEGPAVSLSELVGVVCYAGSCHIKLTTVSSISLDILTPWLILAVPSMIESIWYAPRHA